MDAEDVVELSGETKTAAAALHTRAEEVHELTKRLERHKKDIVARLRRAGLHARVGSLRWPERFGSSASQKDLQDKLRFLPEKVVGKASALLGRSGRSDRGSREIESKREIERHR